MTTLSKYKNYKSLLSVFLISIFGIFIFLYYHFLERMFFFKMRFYAMENTFAVPILFLGILFLYGLIYSKIFKQDAKQVLIPIFLMGIGLHLLYLLLELYSGINRNSAFGSHGRIFVLYANLYFLIIESIFFGIATYIFYKIFTAKRGFLFEFANKTIFQDIIFYSPILIFSFYFIWNFLKEGQLIALFCAVVSIIGTLGVQALDLEKFTSNVCKFKDKIIPIFRKKEFFLLLLFAVAFFVRLSWGLRVISITADNYIAASDDGLTYDPFAALIAQGRTAEIDRGLAFHYGGMGYWYFMAIIYRLFGLHNFHAIVFFQSLLSAAVPICVYYIAKKIFDKTVAMLAAAISIFEMGLIFVTGIIGMEALFVPTILITITLLIYALDRLIQKRNTWVFFVIGLMFGFSNMVRGEVLLFPFLFIFLLVFYMQFNKKLYAREVFVISSFLLAGFFLALFIHAARNYFYYEKFTFLTRQAQITFETNGCKENVILNNLHFNPFKDFIGSLLVFFKNPVIVTKLLVIGSVKKFFIYLLFPNFGIFDPFSIVNPAFLASKYKYPVYFQFYVHIIIIFGIIFSFLKSKKMLLKSIIISYLLYTISIYVMVAPKNPRHRVVLTPFFIIFFALGLVSIAKKIRSRMIGLKNK